MEIVALSILIVIVYFIMMYIFGRTNKNTPKFTLESFISILKINKIIICFYCNILLYLPKIYITYGKWN